jgi:uncharacterized protein DUF222
VGDISYPQVETLVSALSNGREKLYPDHEHTLVGVAKELSIEQFAFVARRWALLADDQLANGDAMANHERRSLYLSPTFGGMVALKGDLDAEGGAMVKAALDDLDRPDPTNGVEKPRTLRQRRADALVELARRHLQDKNAQAGAPTTAVEVVIDYDTLVGNPGGDLTKARCEIVGVGPIARETARRLMCDSYVSRAITRGRSEILDLGRRSRFFTKSQKRALAIIDPECSWPDCDFPPAWCEAHHNDPYAASGETNLDQGFLLCKKHHTDVHEGGYKLRRNPDNSVTTIAPEDRAPP